MNETAITIKRLLALDVFRGMTIILMLLVNNPGSWSHIYPPFRHAPWHGCTLTDLVFPFFMFIVGVSMGFSTRKFGQLPSSVFIRKAIKRGLILMLIGYLMRLFPFVAIDFEKARIMGVLQRIGLAYIFASVLINYFREKTLYFMGGIILLGYWGLLYFGSDAPYTMEDNIVRAVDLMLLGDHKMWHGHGIAFDPEGLLSTLPAIVTILIGYFVAHMIQRKSSLIQLVKKMMIIGLGLVFIGWAWSWVFPINKALWTSSYVLYTAGWAVIVLGLLLYIIDIKGFQKWTKIFVAYGVNPLFLFVLSGLFAKTILRLNWGDTNVYRGVYRDVFVPYFGDLNGSLLFAILHIVIIGIVALILFKKKIFIKV